MGYSPKHAKPVSLMSTALKSQHKSAGSSGTGTGPGRHRIGATVPAPRLPADDICPAGQPAALTEPAPEASPADAGTDDLETARAVEHAEALLRLIPLQRTPLPGS
jgi:hypothetical protein